MAEMLVGMDRIKSAETDIRDDLAELDFKHDPSRPAVEGITGDLKIDNDNLYIRRVQLMAAMDTLAWVRGAEGTELGALIRRHHDLQAASIRPSIRQLEWEAIHGPVNRSTVS